MQRQEESSEATAKDMASELREREAERLLKWLVSIWFTNQPVLLELQSRLTAI